ncbi:MAG TPA: DUF979 domain-containing protein [Pyrinomonadaceae bacterium]|nr:DUF979 domain-containing protein [Pyrinomonadaceae bacterium]
MPSLSALSTTLFSLKAVYVLTGVLLVVFAGLNLRDRTNRTRISTALFWFILGVIFACGGWLPTWIIGLLVLAMVAIDGMGRVGRSATSDEVTKSGQIQAKETSLGNKIFLPALFIPLVTFAFALIFKRLGLNPNDGALVGLGYSGVVAMFVGMALTRGTLGEAFREGRRLNDAMGSVNILPALLASLGVIFTASKIGDLIAQGIHRIIPGQNLFLLIVANCLGMALFTMVMGNSFAAFPVIAAGVLVPLIIKPFGVDPAMVAIVTLTAGSTGTLMTPMAANFNIVPTALLDMRDQYGVIKFQIPFALTIWTMHVLVMWVMIRLL